MIPRVIKNNVHACTYQSIDLGPHRVRIIAQNVWFELFEVGNGLGLHAPQCLVVVVVIDSETCIKSLK